MDYWNVPFNRINNQKPGGCRDVQEEAIQLETNKIYGTIYVCVIPGSMVKEESVYSAVCFGAQFIDVLNAFPCCGTTCLIWEF